MGAEHSCVTIPTAAPYILIYALTIATVGLTFFFCLFVNYPSPPLQKNSLSLRSLLGRTSVVVPDDALYPEHDARDLGVCGRV